ncbi:MAG: insulinase family protein [Phycisphaerales bacterium]|nr:insulinase family protein [Phycisphaerales bacterium]
MPVTFQQHRLSNGLTIIAETDPAAHTTAAGFFVKTGARDEAAPVMGVSHFLEHMMFKGTDDISAEELNRRFDDLGARNNAFTSAEMTCFYASVLPERFDEMVSLLARMMRPALRQADFDTEKGVILEEIAMYKDNPFWVLYEAAIEKHFGAHPLSHRVLGTTETITALTRDQMMDYFRARYSADNTTLAVAGRVDFAKLVALAERMCGTWERTGATRDSNRPRPVGGEFTIEDEKVSRAYILGLADAPAIEDERRYAAGMLAQVLGSPDNSLLHWALIETGLAEEAQAAFDAHDGVGHYFIYASADPARIDDVWAQVQTQVDRLIDAVTPDDLERLRNKAATALTVGGERPGDRMHRLGRLWTTTAQYRPLEAELERIKKVTLDDLRAVAAAYPIRPVTVGKLVPKG